MLVLLASPNITFSQPVKFKSLKSLNVGVKHEALVKVMFTAASEEYFYSTFRNAKVNKANVAKIEAKIRKADSVCVELTLTTNDSKQTKKLLKQASKEFGAPNNKVKTSATTFDQLWSEKTYPGYIESKVWHPIDAQSAYLKIILIRR